MTSRYMPALLAALWCACPALAQDAPPGHAPSAPPATTPQKSRPFLGGFLRESRVIYPLRVGEWEAVDEHLYDEQSLGASVRYRSAKHEERWLDLYFYPAGVLDAKDFEEATRVQRESLAMAGYGQLEMGPTRDFSYPSGPPARGDKDDSKDKPSVSTGHSLEASMVHEGVRLHSAMTLQYERMYFIKGRLSAPKKEASSRALRESLEAFVTALVPQLEVRSSGDCWRPLPITPMPAGGAPAASTILTIDDGSGGKSIVTLQGVLADRPESDAAKMAMLLGMHRLGRLQDGCVATEDLNAPVPEGMRELRLEFHAPDELSSDPAPRLRPARALEG